MIVLMMASRCQCVANGGDGVRCEGGWASQENCGVTELAIANAKKAVRGRVRVDRADDEMVRGHRTSDEHET